MDMKICPCVADFLRDTIHEGVTNQLLGVSHIMISDTDGKRKDIGPCDKCKNLRFEFDTDLERTLYRMLFG